MTYWIIKFLSLIIFKLFYNFRVYGAENIPKKGPYLVCSNHCSFFDPVIVCDSIRQRVYWVALKDLYRIWPLSILLVFAKCIPVNGAIDEALEALSQGKIIGIFPEGRRTYTGQLMKKGKRGAALLAARSGVPVIPAWINGTFEAYPRRAKFPKIHPIYIHFGKPLRFGVHSEEIIDEEFLKSATAKILDAIGKLRSRSEEDILY